jgi:ribosomal protein S8
MKTEKEILRTKVDEYKSMSFEELESLIKEERYIESFEVSDENNGYQIEIAIDWQSKESREISVAGSIYNDKGKWWQRFIHVSTVSYGFAVKPSGVKTDL